MVSWNCLTKSWLVHVFGEETNTFSIKPTLKKVSKYENKFAKLQKKVSKLFLNFHRENPALIFHCQASEFSIRTQLKTVKKKEFAMDEGEAEARFIYLFIIYLDNMMGQVKNKTMAIFLWTF